MSSAVLYIYTCSHSGEEVQNSWSRCVTALRTGSLCKLLATSSPNFHVTDSSATGSQLNAVRALWLHGGQGSWVLRGTGQQPWPPLQCSLATQALTLRGDLVAARCMCTCARVHARACCMPCMAGLSVPLQLVLLAPLPSTPAQCPHSFPSHHQYTPTAPAKQTYMVYIVYSLYLAQ